MKTQLQLASIHSLVHSPVPKSVPHLRRCGVSFEAWRNINLQWKFKEIGWETSKTYPASMFELIIGVQLVSQTGNFVLQLCRRNKNNNM